MHSPLLPTPTPRPGSAGHHLLRKGTECGYCHRESLDCILVPGRARHSPGSVSAGRALTIHFQMPTRQGTAWGRMNWGWESSDTPHPILALRATGSADMESSRPGDYKLREREKYITRHVIIQLDDFYMPYLIRVSAACTACLCWDSPAAACIQTPRLRIPLPASRGCSWGTGWYRQSCSPHSSCRPTACWSLLGPRRRSDQACVNHLRLQNWKTFQYRLMPEIMVFTTTFLSPLTTVRRSHVSSVMWRPVARAVAVHGRLRAVHRRPAATGRRVARGVGSVHWGARSAVRWCLVGGDAAPRHSPDDGDAGAIDRDGLAL